MKLVQRLRGDVLRACSKIGGTRPHQKPPGAPSSTGPACAAVQVAKDRTNHECSQPSNLLSLHASSKVKSLWILLPIIISHHTIRESL